MKKKVEVLKGKIEDLKRIATRTENSMATFKVGGTPCKTFGRGAEILTRWVQDDPNSVGEFEGYFDRRSERFGREFVAAHGKLIETKTIDKIESPEMAVSGTGSSGAASVSELSVSAEPIPANEPIKLKADLAVKEPLAPLSHMPPARAPLPADDFLRVEGVTFEDLENQYKLQKMAREMEKLNQSRSQPSDSSG